MERDIKMDDTKYIVPGSKPIHPVLYFIFGILFSVPVAGLVVCLIISHADNGNYDLNNYAKMFLAFHIIYIMLNVFKFGKLIIMAL